MRLRWLLVLGLFAAAVLMTTVVRDREPTRSEYCTAVVGTVSAQVDLEQAQWSALMAAVAQRRGLSPRATTIAIATAFQESKIHNIDYGDRDSLGLFQQRPSQGWGTVEQVQDPHYSIGKFYDALVKVKGYETLEITVAAQKVQRSAHPGAYAQHEDYARALASSLRGYSPSAFTCQVNPGGGGSSSKVAKDVKAAFGKLDHTIDGDNVRYPLTGKAADIDVRGWALAHYLVANAASLGITKVSFDGLAWTAADSPKGWTTSTASSSVVTASTN